MLALLTNPEQLATLHARPDLIPNAVDEILRFDGPANPGLHRFVLRNFEIGGVTIPSGSYVMLGTASANRDPAMFVSPDSFDVTRHFQAPPLAFGFGIHYCLGAQLAKIESEVVIGALLRRFPDLRLGVEPECLQWRPGFLRALVELPVSVR
jgi:cytochrome P450